MTKEKRYDFGGTLENPTIRNTVTGIEYPSDGYSLLQLVNDLHDQYARANQEVLACHDTLVTIEALCDAVLNYDFKDVESKADFCHMLNELDNKDLMFFKECFEAIRGNDLMAMHNLTMECNVDDL